MAAPVAVPDEVVKNQDPTQIEVKLFNRWSFDEVQVYVLYMVLFMFTLTCATAFFFFSF